MRSHHLLPIGVGGVARLPQYATANMGGTVPDQLGEVLNAFAKMNIQKTLRFSIAWQKLSGIRLTY